MKSLSRGFTLIELMATLAVLGITLTVGVPAVTKMIENARATNAWHRLTGSMAMARMSAIGKGHAVVVCPSSDGRSCRDDVIWSDGWIVFRAPAGRKQPASGDDVLQRIEGVSGGLALRSTRGRRQVRFTPDGWSYGSNLSIRLCSGTDSELLGKVVVNNAGRPRVERAEPGTACPFSL